MRHNKLSSQGFTLLTILLMVLVVAIVGAVGYLVFKHEDNKVSPVVPSVQNPRIYSYSGYKFPKLPNTFTETSKTNSGPYPSVSYTSASSLNQVEKSLITVCNNTKYSVEGAFVTATNSSSGNASTKSYEMSCDTKNNQWEFNITADAHKSALFDISVMSMPVLTGGTSAAR